MQETASSWKKLRAIGSVLGLIVVTWLCSAIVGLALIAVLHAFAVGLQSPLSYGVQIVTQALVFMGVPIAYSRYSGVELPVRRPTIAHLGYVLVGTLGLLVLAVLIGKIITELGIPSGTNQIERIARRSPQFLLALIPIAVVLIGPSEEVLFRGGVQGRLRQVFGPTTAIVLASLLFGFMHIPAIVSQSAAGVGSYILTTFLLGLVLGALYEYTDTLVVPAFAHGLYNAVLFVGLYVSIT